MTHESSVHAAAGGAAASLREHTGAAFEARARQFAAASRSSDARHAIGSARASRGPGSDVRTRRQAHAAEPARGSTRAGPGCCAKTRCRTQTGSGSGPGTGPNTRISTGSDADADADADADTDTGTGTDAVSDAETDTDPGTGISTRRTRRNAGGQQHAERPY